MNGEQLHDWLANLHDRLAAKQRAHQHQAETNGGYESTSSAPSAGSSENPAQWRATLQELAPATNMLLNYFSCNFEDTGLSAPLVAQLISLYYKFDVARCFVLQLIPTFIHSYLKARNKRWIDASRMLETLFLAVYNEEILAAGPGTPSMAKRSEDIRLPFLRQTTVVPGDSFCAPKIQVCPQAETASVSFRTAAGGSQAKLLSASVSNSIGGGSHQHRPHSLKSPASIVRVGPYPAIDSIIAENRFTVLTRLMRAVSLLLPHMAPEVVCRSLCRSMLYICRSGFSFHESDFRQRLLREWANDEVFADFSKKSRIRVCSQFLVESINGVNHALLNGHEDIALRALDAIHQRAQYEMMADVLLETNALRHALSDTETLQSILAKHNTGEGGGQQMHKNKKEKNSRDQRRPVVIPTIDFSLCEQPTNAQH